MSDYGSLSLSELVQIVEDNPPPEFLGVTFSPAGVERFITQTGVDRVTMSGIPFAVLHRQTEDCLQWNDETLFQSAIEANYLCK